MNHDFTPILGLNPKLPSAVATDFLKLAGQSANGWLAYDKHVPAFKKEIEIRHQYFKSPYAVFCNSSTTMHEMLFRSLKAKNPQLQAIVFQENAFPSILFAAERAGFKTIVLPVDLSTGMYSKYTLENIEFSPKYTIIHSTDIGGNLPCQEVRDFLKFSSFMVIEDAAHSWLPSQWSNSIMNLDFADFKVYSFSPTKPLTTAGGGCLVGDSEKHSEVLIDCEMMGRYGRENRFGNGDFRNRGYGSLFSEIDAAMGLAGLKHYDALFSVRTILAETYDKLLKELPVKVITSNTPRSLYKYIISIENQEKANGLQSFLADTSKIFKPIKLSAKVYDSPAEFSNVFLWHERHLCLPMHNYMTTQQVEYVVKRVETYLKD